jgi:hypothetical protein
VDTAQPANHTTAIAEKTVVMKNRGGGEDMELSRWDFDERKAKRAMDCHPFKPGLFIKMPMP